MAFGYYRKEKVICCGNCKTRQSIRNSIFNLNSTSNLSIGTIFTIIWYWSQGHSVTYTSQNLNLSKKTVIRWLEKIRSALCKEQEKAAPMGGPGYVVQLDESLFQGKRKYNRGRLLKSDKKPKESLADQLRSMTRGKKSKRNYGNRIQGPWVFGLVCQKISDLDHAKLRKTNRSKKIKEKIIRIDDKAQRRKLYQDNRKLNTKEFRNYGQSRSYQYQLVPKETEKRRNELRMFVVDKRDAATLIPIIQQNVLPGTIIVSDEWRSYGQLKNLGYRHFTVNHSKNFVDPKSGQHTQLIECYWGYAKHLIMRSRRGTTKDLLPYHLAEIWFRSTRAKAGHAIFKEVLYLLKNNK